MLVVTKMESKIGESLRSISLPDGEIYLTDMSNRVLASTTNSTGEVIVLPDGSEGEILREPRILSLMTSSMW